MAEIAAAPIAKLGRVCERYRMIMDPDAHETDDGTDRPDVSETRIALTFFGGVSLAVYESGAAVEFFRLVTGDGVYKKLREKIGRPIVVDIISGTSAGALSASFLANALVNQSPNLDKVMELWLDRADLDTLFNVETEKATSLLNGKKFLELIEEALREQVKSGEQAKPEKPDESDRVPKHQQEYLDLFITATSLEGDVRDIQLDKLPNVKARSHQRVFQFRYRKGDIDQEKQNDFAPGQLHLLARAARASASFPLAFDPVLIKKDEFDRYSPGLTDDCHYIDGGILDNKPIRLAIEAIAHRQANKQIDRRFFYVEPLPEEINPATGAPKTTQKPGDTPEHLKPINVLYAAVKDLPSYQSITSALEEIASRNRELDALRRTLHHYETLAEKAGNNGVAGKIKARMVRIAGSKKVWGPAAATDGKYHPAFDIPTQLFRAQEDGYLDLRLERHFPPLFAQFQDFGREIYRRAEGDDPRYTRAHKEFYFLKRNVLWTHDFEYHIRQYHYLTQVVRDLFDRLEKGEKHLFDGVPNLRHEIYLSLNRLRTLFNKQERQLLSMQQDANRNPAELHPIEGSLDTLRLALELLPSGRARAGVRAFSDAVSRFTKSKATKQRWSDLAQLHEIAKTQLETERARFLNEDVMKHMSAGIKDELRKGYVVLDAALQGFYYRDMIIYPMMRGSEMLASELQRIRVARFGPLNGDHYMNLSDPRHKLAGEEALRFGGFMDATWRGNDLIWGRLDAVENIFYQLLPKGKEDALFVSCVGDEQRRIVREMREKFDKGIVHPLSKQNRAGEPPPEKWLIGKQNLQNISEEKRIRWLTLGIGRLIRSIPVPRMRLPIWVWQRVSRMTQTGMSRFFVAVLVRPKPAALLLLGACVTIIGGVSFLGACALRTNWGHPHPLLGWTGDMVAIFWLLFIALTSLMIAGIATRIRTRLLKINPPSAELDSGSM